SFGICYNHGVKFKFNEFNERNKFILCIFILYFCIIINFIFFEKLLFFKFPGMFFQLHNSLILLQLYCVNYSLRVEVWITCSITINDIGKMRLILTYELEENNFPFTFEAIDS